MKQLLVTILVLLTSIYSFAESDTLQVNTSNLCIEVYTMIPQRYSSRTVNDYSLCLKGDTVVCNLPYMGRAYSTSYSEQDAPLTFTLPTKNKEVQQKSGKKPKTTISFTCHKATITYNFKIEFLPKGSAYINVIPSNADGISLRAITKQSKTNKNNTFHYELRIGNESQQIGCLSGQTMQRIYQS